VFHLDEVHGKVDNTRLVDDLYWLDIHSDCQGRVIYFLFWQQLRLVVGFISQLDLNVEEVVNAWFRVELDHVGSLVTSDAVNAESLHR
jgi:hypothetical protein